ncbi:hypothetical protein [Granulicatella seriolae]|uniref:Uncharacterized protein n=1 Tax=Granulicatella seriolae TaxID=2967226 RepID=A0ABT1WRD0_9LACT|nr:hypothetical protein [Granulicatella seriolae]
MSKKQLLYIEVVFPTVWMLSFIIWKTLVRKMVLLEALQDAVNITVMLYLLVNLLLYINYDKAFSDDE